MHNKTVVNSSNSMWKIELRVCEQFIDIRISQRIRRCAAVVLKIIWSFGPVILADLAKHCVQKPKPNPS